jgi:hypothetical protein
MCRPSCYTLQVVLPVVVGTNLLYTSTFISKRDAPLHLLRALPVGVAAKRSCHDPLGKGTHDF